MTPGAVVFLGNPGKEYEKTRHNVGFQVCAHWPRGYDLIWQQKFKGEWSSIPQNGRKLVLLKPLTYMNLSGESVRALGDFFKVAPEAWVAVHDDIDVPLGEVRYQFGGGLGGHNGLRSIKQHLGTDQFHRLRVGVGRPTRGDVATFVLGRFTPDEEIALDFVWPRTAEILDEILSEA